MVTISKPISAGQAQAYHKEEFANAKENYYTEGARVRGEMCLAKILSGRKMDVILEFSGLFGEVLYLERSLQ